MEDKVHPMPETGPSDGRERQGSSDERRQVSSDGKRQVSSDARDRLIRWQRQVSSDARDRAHPMGRDRIHRWNTAEPIRWTPLDSSGTAGTQLALSGASGTVNGPV